MYSLFSIVCIAILLIISLGCIFAIFTKERGKRIEFIRKFKKGNCAIVYIATIPLYFIGHIYAGQKILPALFSAINKTMVLVVLRYDSSSISQLMKDNKIYAFAVYFCFILVTINAMLFALSFLHQKFWEQHQSARWRRSQKEKLLIVGNNEENLKIYASEKSRITMLIDDISDQEKTKLYSKRVSFISKNGGIDDIKEGQNKTTDVANDIEKYCCKLLLNCLSSSKKSCVIVINTKDDRRNISLCHKIIACTNKFFKDKASSVISDNLTRIRVYVFGMPDHEAIYNSLAEASNGCIRYINKYRQIAIDFIDRYPLTQFMTGKQIDYKTSLLRNGVNVNVAMIGFGKTNQQIFLTSVANNQFLVEENGKKVLKQVKYYIFDKHHTENNKNLNHSYYRFKNEFEDEIIEQAKNGGNQPYLPFPAFPAEEHYDKLDINDSDFYRKVRTALSGKGNFNYIIIGFGTDLENIDMAQKVLQKKQEWGLEDTYIFVKIRSGDDAYEIFKRDDCFMIGDEKQVVYNIKRIDNDTITHMAKMRNRIYSLEFEITSKPNKALVEPIPEIYAKSDCDWYIKKTQFERESNLYGCLSLRSKLHLMGMDYVPDDGKEKIVSIGQEAYLNCYAEGDKVNYYDDISADGKKIVKYDLSFKNSRRTTMAIQEHFRWNSFMLSKGFVPSSKKEILDDKNKNGKNYQLRRHGNLTTFEGLEEFRKIVAQRDGVDEIATDVIKYDYQLLDDAYWLLSNNNYKIISRQK